jgi:hypothetical protein
VKLVFLHAEGFKMKQRAVIKFCVKLQKTATEMFELLKSKYKKQVCLNDIKGSLKGSNSENAKITSDNNDDWTFLNQRYHSL